MKLKHECGVAMIRLLKPLEYYHEKYGTWTRGLDLLYLLMEKQHNRGQEAAGVGVVKTHALPGHEYVYREREQGTDAIAKIFDKIGQDVAREMRPDLTATEAERLLPFVGEIYMGHLRYSTTGKSGLQYVHPFLRRNNWRSRNLLLCGNFNLTNVDKLFERVVASGQHPRIYSDTIMLLEQLGHALDKENHRIYREFRDTMVDPELSHTIEHRLDMRNVLAPISPEWDGGFVICGATGSGDMFVLRDRAGIRPAFYYQDDEVVVVASERPVIQTVLNVPRAAVHELDPGCAIIVNKNLDINIERILPEAPYQACSFERIYFSRGSDADIYRERKALGRNVLPAVLDAVDHNLRDTVFSFIPNTAEVAFLGMCQELQQVLDADKKRQILDVQAQGDLTAERLDQIMRQELRIEKVALKDIKLRTFIAEGTTRNELAAHVYDVSYGIITNNRDNLVVIDDSIVRGTTLQQSILRMLDRLHPRKIVVVSSSPQVRYPDYYGIDMSRMNEFIAFRAAVELLKLTGRAHVLEQTYHECRRQLTLPDPEQVNAVKAIYAPFTDQEISRHIATMLQPGVQAQVEVIYQTIEGMHQAIPGHPGDWYFSGNYPTPGGNRLVNQAYINFYEGNLDRR